MKNLLKSSLTFLVILFLLFLSLNLLSAIKSAGIHWSSEEKSNITNFLFSKNNVSFILFLSLLFTGLISCIAKLHRLPVFLFTAIGLLLVFFLPYSNTNQQHPHLVENEIIPLSSTNYLYLLDSNKNINLIFIDTDNPDNSITHHPHAFISEQGTEILTANNETLYTGETNPITHDLFSNHPQLLNLTNNIQLFYDAYFTLKKEISVFGLVTIFIIPLFLFSLNFFKTLTPWPLLNHFLIIIICRLIFLSLPLLFISLDPIYSIFTNEKIICLLIPFIILLMITFVLFFLDIITGKRINQ